jgi:hypothetical protein
MTANVTNVTVDDRDPFTILFMAETDAFRDRVSNSFDDFEEVYALLDFIMQNESAPINTTMNKIKADLLGSEVDNIPLLDVQSVNQKNFDNSPACYIREKTETSFYGPNPGCTMEVRKCHCDRGMCDHARNRDCCLKFWPKKDLSVEKQCSWKDDVREKFRRCRPSPKSLELMRDAAYELQYADTFANITQGGKSYPTHMNASIMDEVYNVSMTLLREFAMDSCNLTSLSVEDNAPERRSHKRHYVHSLSYDALVNDIQNSLHARNNMFA